MKEIIICILILFGILCLLYFYNNDVNESFEDVSEENKKIIRKKKTNNKTDKAYHREIEKRNYDDKEDEDDIHEEGHIHEEEGKKNRLNKYARRESTNNRSTNNRSKNNRSGKVYKKENQGLPKGVSKNMDSSFLPWDTIEREYQNEENRTHGIRKYSPDPAPFLDRNIKLDDVSKRNRGNRRYDPVDKGGKRYEPPEAPYQKYVKNIADDMRSLNPIKKFNKYIKSKKDSDDESDDSSDDESDDMRHKKHHKENKKHHKENKKAEEDHHHYNKGGILKRAIGQLFHSDKKHDDDNDYISVVEEESGNKYPYKMYSREEEDDSSDSDEDEYENKVREAEKKYNKIQSKNKEISNKRKNISKKYREISKKTGKIYPKQVEPFSTLTYDSEDNEVISSPIPTEEENEKYFMEPDRKILSDYGFVYMPNSGWSVPQQRPPACIPQEKCVNGPVPVFTTGAPADAVNYSGIGSILPKFEYKELYDKKCYQEGWKKRYNPDYYYPGWIAKSGCNSGCKK